METLAPAVYARAPKADVSRRNNDKDPVSRAASQILQRSLQFELDFYNDFDSALRNVVLDRLLPGRGAAWVRFEPASMPPAESLGDQVTDDTINSGSYECCPTDYVFWEDFRMSPPALGRR